MPLSAGSRLGPYEILAPLGAGGMGEVYRARDSRLGREVAIKVLPAEVAKDRDRLARFEQEARAASALNHPNIVTLHDIGRSDDTVYIAMELVDGQTLGTIVTSGPMPVRRFLAVAAQVAEGLAKAHAAGIVHRDLKPENVMVTSDGFVKILDFGLAKLVADASDAHSALPTLGPPQTHPGTVLGTVGYMSPEQAAGLPLDFRTDQFSFGSILYEMATGKRAFLRATSVDTLAAILHEEPEPIARVSPAVPAPLRWIVERCLEKDPKARYASTLDLARELGSVRDHVSELSGGASTLSSETRHRSRGRLLVGGLAAATLLIGLAAGYLLRGRERHATSAASKRVLNLALPPGEEMVLTGHPSLAISPDGSRVVYRGRSGTADALYVRSLDSLEAKHLQGTEGALNPFFSPDGAWVGFGADGKLRKAALSGGPPQTICDAPNLRGASWGEDGTILFASTSGSGLFRVAENGGAPAAATTLDPKKGEKTHRFPQILPGGKAAILTVHDLTGDYERARIDAVSLETGKRQVVLEGATDPRYLPTGHLLYLRGRSLFAVAFDAAALRATGSPVPVVDGIWSFPAAGFAQIALSASGDLVYLPSDPLAFEGELVWMDRKGVARPLSDNRRPYNSPRLSPDGRRLAVTVYERGKGAIWIYDLSRNAWEQLTTGEGAVPVWSPDGKQIAFGSNRAGSYNIFVAPTDRSAPARQVTKTDSWPFAQAWSPDGRLLLYLESPAGSSAHLGVVSADGNGEMKPLFRLTSSEGVARISPDGAWMAYESNESGRLEVYLARFPQPTGRTQVTTEGGSSPAWSKDGREIFFRNGNRLMAADVVLGSEPRAGVPRVLFETAFQEFEPAPDGQSFAVLRRAHPNLPQKPLVVVLGFGSEVERLLATKK